MYLLRLAMQTGPVVNYLDGPTAAKVITRINKIVRQGIFEKQVIGWVKASAACGQFTEYEEKE